MNWVEREVRLALARATGAGAIPFVPILAPALGDPTAALPAFAQQHHGVFDPLQRPEEFAKLLAAVLGRSEGPPPRATDEPFVGLRAMTERESDRFFGRDAELAELVADLRRNRLVAIVADSGAGKSSLAMAGLAPAYRGGALADPARRAPDEALWHVVVMRPGGNPLEGLRRGVTEAAQRMGLSPDAQAGLRKRLSLEDADEAAYALRCDLPANATETLLIVDQFDELLTETPETLRAPFVDLLLRLARMRGRGGFHVVLTVRVDYFNLCRPFEELYGALQGADNVLRLKRISDAGLEQAVRAPLRMAGHVDAKEQDALATQTRRDLGDRPGDLALAQMALWTVWRNRGAHGGSLLEAYVDVGGVSGALAQEAERVRETKLNDAEREVLPALLVRLVRLGETGGVLRRVAEVGEFDPKRLALAQKLASDDYGRLLMVGESSPGGEAKLEVCHEALITQWPWLQNTLNAAAADLRALERLMDRAGRWRGAAEALRTKHLATGAERELFGELRQKRDEWLSAAERDFVAASDAAFLREEKAKRVLRGAVAAAMLGLIGFAAFAGWEWHAASEAEKEANAQRAKAEKALALATQTANGLVFDLAQKFRDVSGVPAATVRDILDRAGKLQEQLQEGGAKTSDLLRSQAATLDETVQSRLAMGDVKGALAAARQSVAIMQSLSASDPSNTSWRRDLSVCHNKVGDVLTAQGDLPGALKSYRDGLAIAEALSVAGPGNAAWRRDLSVSYDRVGDVLVAQGDLAGALKSYRNSLAIAEALSAADPGNAEWRRDLSVSYDKVGDVLKAQGDLAGALKSYRDGHAIFRALSAADPGNAEWRRDLSVSYDKIGDVLETQGDLAGALKSYRDGLAIFEAVSASDPGNAEWRRDVFAGYWRLATVEPTKAREHFTKARAILKELSDGGRLAPVDAKWLAEVDEKLKALDAPAAKPSAAPAAKHKK